MSTHRDTQVNQFQPHDAAPRRDSSAHKATGDGERLRLRANCLSAVAVLALLVIGTWAENGLVNAMRDSGTCYRPGGSDCAAVYMPAPPPSVGHWS
jgi:hypothetical protein